MYVLFLPDSYLVSSVPSHVNQKPDSDESQMPTNVTLLALSSRHFLHRVPLRLVLQQRVRVIHEMRDYLLRDVAERDDLELAQPLQPHDVGVPGDVPQQGAPEERGVACEGAQGGGTGEELQLEGFLGEGSSILGNKKGVWIIRPTAIRTHWMNTT